MTKILEELQNIISTDISEIISELNPERLILYILQDREYLFSPIRNKLSKFITQNNDKLTKLKTLSIIRRKIKDFNIYITKQDYKLEIKDKVITLFYDIEKFIKYYNIGYLRTSLADLNLSMMSLANKKFDVLDAIL